MSPVCLEATALWASLIVFKWHVASSLTHLNDQYVMSGTGLNIESEDSEVKERFECFQMLNAFWHTLQKLCASLVLQIQTRMNNKKFGILDINNVTLTAETSRSPNLLLEHCVLVPDFPKEHQQWVGTSFLYPIRIFKRDLTITI